MRKTSGCPGADEVIYYAGCSLVFHTAPYQILSDSIPLLLISNQMRKTQSAVSASLPLRKGVERSYESAAVANANLTHKYIPGS